MLNNVPIQVNKAARAVVLRHPNSMDCVVYRKRLLRTADTEEGGLPTIGGMALLDSEDESEVDWDELGAGKLLFVEKYQPSDINDRGDNVDLSYPEMVVLIEPEVEPTDPSYFRVMRHDIVYLLFGDSVKIAYEVTNLEGDVLIPPHSVRFVLQKRDALTYINGFPPS